MKTFLTGTLLLTVGLAVGWWARGTLLARVFQPRAHPITSSAQAAQIVAAVPAANGKAVLPPKLSTTSSTVERLRVLADLNLHSHSRYSVPAVMGTKLSESFIEIFGLTPAETASLNASLEEANARINEIASQLATAQTDDANQTLTVHVPPFPDAGGIVHDQIFAAFKTVLGPDRYEAFNVLSAEGLEYGFSSFGLNDTRYVLKLTPISKDYKGEPVYDIEAKHTTPINNGWGSSHSTMNAAGITPSFPVLARFLPSGFTPPKK